MTDIEIIVAVLLLIAHNRDIDGDYSWEDACRDAEQFVAFAKQRRQTG